MATAITTVWLNCHNETLSSRQIGSLSKPHTISLISIKPKTSFSTKTSLISIKSQRHRFSVLNELRTDSNHSGDNNPEVQLDNKDGQVDNVGVRAALSMLRFYKREISPFLPKSCRYVPTCSEYSMQAYKKYGVGKGTVLTAWRLCRCNPLGGSGFDPPRWFGEKAPTLEEEEDDTF